MEQEIKIQGYLECNGSIIKIMSLDDVKNFVLNYGKAVNEITEDELDKLACVKWDGENEYKDDLGVCYISNPHVLYKFRFSNSGFYKVEDGTVAVAKEAVRYQYFGNRWTDIDYLRLADTVLIIGTAAFGINKNAQNVNGLGHIDLSSSLIKIGDRAFENCRMLNEIIFPETLKYIGVNAFSGCDFSSIVIPSGVKRIGRYAFRDNARLKSVIFKGIPKIISQGRIFDNCPIEEIKIPKGSIDYFEKELYPISKDKFIEE